MTGALLGLLTQVPGQNARHQQAIYQALANGDLEPLRDVFQAFFASIPNDWYRKHQLAGYEVDHDDLSSKKKIVAIFDDASRWFDDTNFHGCLAVNAMAEFSGKDQAIEDSCIAFKRWEIEVLRHLTDDFDAKNPDELAHKLFVLLEGMSSIAQVTQGTYPVDMTKMAIDIIAMHLSSSQNDIGV